MPKKKNAKPETGHTFFLDTGKNTKIILVKQKEGLVFVWLSKSPLSDLCVQTDILFL